MNLQQLAERLKGLLGPIPQLAAAASGAKQAVNDFRTDFDANKAYYSDKIKRAILPSYDVPKYADTIGTMKKLDDARQKSGESEADRQYRLMKNAIFNTAPFDPEYQGESTVKGGSADLAQIINQYNDPSLDDIKKRTLDKMNLRPAMRRYLETIPVQVAPIADRGAAGLANIGGEYPSEKGGTWETDFSNVPQNKNIILDNGYTNDQSVLSHEYLHVTPRSDNVKKGMERLLNTLKSGNKENIIYQNALKYFSDGRLPPNPEELFATLGQTLGRYVLMMPEIQQYYSAIYSQNNVPNAPYPIQSTAQEMQAVYGPHILRIGGSPTIVEGSGGQPVEE